VVIKDTYYAFSEKKSGKSCRLSFNVPVEWMGTKNWVEQFYDFPIAWQTCGQASGLLLTPSLVVAGSVYAADVFVQPSVRKKELGLELTLANPSPSQRKVRILNGAHTALVAKALPMGLQTVRAAVEHPVVRPWLEALLFEEIVPVLEGRTEEPAQFARWTLERFANPFLEHRLADIALHHEVKLRSRLWPTLEEYRRHFGRPPRLLGEILKSTGPA